MELKKYQRRTLEILREFFERARTSTAAAAYHELTAQPEQIQRLDRQRHDYTPLQALPEVPYICLRLPTGGGKTMLAAHAIKTVRDSWIEKEYPLVLWLTPSNIIRRQTAEVLKNPAHPYRQVLDRAFQGRVRVFDIADFANIRPHDLRDNLCIAVGAIQALRVTNTDGRKVYAHNENLESHFTGIAGDGMECSEDGKIKFSFANILHRHRPLMIVDEAHNAVTGLTREMQQRVNPCAIVEFTATPDSKSNILYRVRAQELKREQMLKLPIQLWESQTWQEAISGAIAKRAELEKEAGKEADLIRPLVLFQAQSKDREVTVDVLKNYLINDENIKEQEIAIATGEKRDLDDINLFDSGCPIRYVITVQALKEGWDCSFAYIFCSVSRIQSATAVEQLLGRVLRMPHARKRKSEALNKAYAYLSDPDFGQAALGLVDKLVEMGFDTDEAQENIETERLWPEEEDELFPPSDHAPPFKYKLPVNVENLASFDEMESAGIVALDRDDAGAEIVISAGDLTDENIQRIVEVLPYSEREKFTREIDGHRELLLAHLPPARQGPFIVPRLVVSMQQEIMFAETELFMDRHGWSLSDHPALLEESEFSITKIAHGFEIDLDGDRVTYTTAGEQEWISPDSEVKNWQPQHLVLWLDRKVRRRDLHQSELLRWLSDLIQQLTTQRGINIRDLMRYKFLLAREIERKLNTLYDIECDKAYQKYLFSPSACPEISFEHGFIFKEGMYSGQRRYRGRWTPNKYFLGSKRVAVFDGAENGEEMQCAQNIDRLNEVKYWIRNISRHPESFSLPRARGRFYPDFIALLQDGRLLVVEYKGAHYADGIDSAEKRTIGELWERKSEGKGLFLMVEFDINGRDMNAQLLGKINGV